MFPPFCLYLSVYSNFSRSFLPHFSYLPPASSVYVRLHSVYKFQFNSLRAQSRTIRYLKFTNEDLSLCRCSELLVSLPASFSTSEAQADSLKVALNLFRQLLQIISLEEEIYYLKLSSKCLFTIIHNIWPHYQNFLKTPRGKLIPNIYHSLLPFLAPGAWLTKHGVRGCPRQMSSLSPVVKLSTFSFFLLLRSFYKRICLKDNRILYVLIRFEISY